MPLEVRANRSVVGIEMGTKRHSVGWWYLRLIQVEDDTPGFWKGVLGRAGGRSAAAGEID